MIDFLKKLLKLIVLYVVLTCLLLPQKPLTFDEAYAASPRKPVAKKKTVKTSQKSNIGKLGKTKKNKAAVSARKSTVSQRKTVGKQQKIDLPKETQKKLNTLELKKVFNNAAPIPYKGGFVKKFNTAKKEIYYRVFSGKDISGAWLVKSPPKTSAHAREVLNLPPRNKATMIQKVIVPKGIQLERSRALGGGLYGGNGGGEQFRILPGPKNKGIVFEKGIPLK